MTDSSLPQPGPCHPGHEDLLRALRALIPSAFSDGKVDWENLRAALGGETTPQDRYRFTWAGKDDATRLMQTRTLGALHPRRENSIDWESTKNVFIEGENLEVLKLLYNAYFAAFRLAFIAPPYNTGDDPIYVDDYTDHLSPYLSMLKEKGARGPLKSIPASHPNHHSTWLSMLYPRIAIARQLLREDGFLVVSIDDGEIYHLRLLLNEVFGEENHIATLVWDRSRKNDAKLFSIGHEYMVVYARNAQHLKDTDVVLRAPKDGIEEARKLWDTLRDEHGDDFESIGRIFKEYLRGIKTENDPRKPLKRYSKVDAGGPYREDGDLSWHGGGGPTYELLHPTTGKPCQIPSRGWVYPTLERMNEEISKGRVIFGPDESTVPSRKSYMFEKASQVMSSVSSSYSQVALQAFRDIFDGAQVFDNVKHYEDVRALVEYLTDEGDLVLDFFAGSATTGHAVFESNRHSGSHRRFVLVQLQEPIDEQSKWGQAAKTLGFATIAEIGQDRLRRVIRRTLEAQSLTAGPSQDLGVRVFELRESNFTPWPNEPLEEHTLELFLHRIRSGANPEALLWELVLREGYPLSSRIQELTGPACSVYRVSDEGDERVLFVCLGGTVTCDLPDTLGMSSDQTLVCPDVALTDELAANLSSRCRLKTY